MVENGEYQRNETSLNEGARMQIMGESARIPKTNLVSGFRFLASAGQADYALAKAFPADDRPMVRGFSPSSTPAGSDCKT